MDCGALPQVIHNYPSFTAFSLFRSASSPAWFIYKSMCATKITVNHCCYCCLSVYVWHSAIRVAQWATTYPAMFLCLLVISNKWTPHKVVCCNHIAHSLIIRCCSTSVALVWHVKSPVRGCFCNLWNHSVGENDDLSNTVYLYRHYQNFAQALSRKACRAGERHCVLVKNSSIKRLPNASRYHILCLCQIRTQYVVINWVFLRV